MRHRFSKHRKKLLLRTIVSAFATLSAGAALAEANYLQAPDVSDPGSWSAGDSSGEGANIINRLGLWFADDLNYRLTLGSGLLIGYQVDGRLEITVASDASYTRLRLDPFDSAADPELPPLTPNWDPSFRVGIDGGDGSLMIDLLELPEDEWSESRLEVDHIGLGIGLGQGSRGSVDILGTGKNSTEISLESPNEVFFGWSEENFYIGHTGGEGKLTINGAGFTAGIGQDYDSNLPLNYFSVGEGAGSVGKVDVLNSGKLAVGTPIEADVGMRTNELPLGFIGKAGGQGTVTVAQGTSEHQGQANFYLGLAVGHSGGTGTLNVLQGGKSFVGNSNTWDFAQEGECAANSPNASPPTPAPLLISADGSSQGLVRASGAGSELLVTGISYSDFQSDETSYIKQESIGEIEIGSGGTLVVENSSAIKVGVSRLQEQEGMDRDYFSRSTVGGLGPVTITGSGSVVYGSETVNPSNFGHIEASSINLASSEARLRFNHTGNLSFNLPLAGSGLLTQQAGTTTVETSLAVFPQAELDAAQFEFDPIAPCTPAIASGYPTDQADFLGGIDVQGGTLILPTDNVLPNLSSTRISAGRLMMGSTNQNLGAVNLAGGFLQLSGGSAPSATNTAVASTWTGSNGTVVLDTVLGADGSASDKLFITGAITGTTLLQIANLGGSGMQTTGTGILVVETEAGANPSNSFALAAPVISNGFQYRLQQTDNNWYLVSSPYVAPPQQATPVPATSLLGLLGLGGLLAAFARRSLTTKDRRKA